MTKGPETYINRFVNIEAYGRKSGKCKGFRRFHLQKMTAYAMAEKTGMKKNDAEKALKAFVDVVTDELVKGEKIQLVGFGTFEVSERPEREGRNPRTGETMKIAASKAPKFKAGKALKDMINA